LSERQRSAIRDEIKTRISSGVPKKAIVKALSAKYKISPITLRWYIRTQPGIEKSHKFHVVAPSVPAATEHPGGASGGHGVGSASVPLTSILNQLSDKRVKRLLAAKKLVPELELVRRHESAIRGKIRNLQRQLQADESKARAIEQRIKRLSGF
jgi:hypothetical protein